MSVIKLITVFTVLVVLSQTVLELTHSAHGQYIYVDEAMFLFFRKRRKKLLTKRMNNWIIVVRLL